MNKNAGISYLRILATACVVFLHVCSTITDNPDLFHITNTQNWFFNAGHMITMWTVPCFLMITGSLLLNSEHDFTVRFCYRKYIRRMVLVLIIFGIPFAGLIQFSDGVRGVDLVWKSVVAVLRGRTLSHLWYIYTLVGVYLLLPIFKAFVSKVSEQEIRIMLVVLCIFTIVIPTINSTTRFHIVFSIPLGWPIFYVLSGYYLMKRNKRLKAGWLVVLLLLVFSAFKPEWMAYDNTIVAVTATLIFSAFVCNRPVTNRLVEQGTEDDKFDQGLWMIDRLCFGVYIIHPVFIHCLYRVLKITPVNTLYPITTFGIWILVLGLSFIGSWILSKIKPLKKYVL